MDDDEFVNQDDIEPKSPSAVDFYDINELCDETEETNAKISLSNDTDQDSENDDVLEEKQVSFISAEGLKDTVVNDKEYCIPAKPLASVLPLKYQNVDVKELFPAFRDGEVLRFQRLFGPGKPSNMPDIWRSVRKRKEVENKLAAQNYHEKTEQTASPDIVLESDEEIQFMKDAKCYLHNPSSKTNVNHCNSLNNSWRFGPAKLWYDMVQVPETAETYDYGFKLKEKQYIDEHMNFEDPTPDHAFLMVSQCNWEDNVIWDGDDIREEVMKNVYSTKKAAGWIPVSTDRTVSSYNEHVKLNSSQSDFKTPLTLNCFDRINMNKANGNLKVVTFQSMFPEENPKLLYDRWEDDIIWDCDAMERISYPKPLEISDKDIITEIPDDDPVDVDSPEPTKDRRDRKYRPIVRKTVEDPESLDPVNIKHDFYNISNDEYYNMKMTQDEALKLNYGGSLLQHSIPAVELQTPYFPTYMGPLKLRRFHRPTLKQYSHGPLSQIDFHGVHSLTVYIKQKERERQKELEESGGGEMFFMRTPADLSGKDGELVLFEFSEEHPPLMSQIGMASKIRNYYRRRPGKDTSSVDYKYGEIAYAHTSPFLGTLQPGESLQAYENHLFRSPIYEHTTSDTDFLIIRTRHNYFIRELHTIFTVGQELPLLEVPAPKSERANNFIRDFLMVYIYRQFWKSVDNPRRIKMEDIRKAFPSHREFSIRKRLNLCADFQRTGFDSKYWVLKSTFRLPPEEEIRKMLSPEQCCAYYSMLAAEQRLKDAGYGDKFLLMAEDDTGSLQNKIDDEVKAAPWNTTQAFISAVRGKCLLELIGVADPTGCGEGFAYVKVPNKPQWLKDECKFQNPARRLVKGTDADLRRLSLSNAKKLLKSFNVPDREIKRLSRWEVIDVVRTLSTEQAKLGEEGVTKFARGNFFSQAEHQRKYKEECQRLFDLQNQVLSSKEVLSTDEDSSSEEDSDLEEMGKHIENILSNKKSIKELSHECEEAERKELQKLMSTELQPEDGQKIKNEKNISPSMEGKILKIYRTYRNIDGSEFVRVETVRKREVVELYCKIRETKDEEFIKNYAIDEEQKEAYRRERRRLQDQLRRLKRNELKEKDMKEPIKKKVKVDTSNMFRVKCGACGATGHMRTNKACPLYQPSSSLPPIQVAMTEEQEEAEEKAGLDDQNLIKLDETKIIVSKQLIKHADEIRRKSLVLKIPKEAVNAAKRKRTYEVTSSDYLSFPKFVNRKRIDPVVSISVIFENLLNEIKSLPDTQPFWFPVSSKVAPNYHTFIQKPMDLHTMRDKVRQQQYKSREDFLNDITQILENSKLYNGSHSFLSLTAQTMLDHCIKFFSDKEEKLMQLEKAINPLLDDDQVAFSFILESIVAEQLKAVPESWPFHKPVDKRLAKGYYDIVKTPMDLDTIIRNCKSHKYKTISSFFCDVQLILTNSLTFNGSASQFTKIAQQIVDTCHASLEIYKDQLERLELGIKELESDQPSVSNYEPSPKRTKYKMNANSPKSFDSHKNGSSASHNNIDQSNCNDSIAPSNCSESVDMDSFVDVEFVDIGENGYADKELLSSDKSDSEAVSIKRYKCQDSNSPYAYSPPPDYIPEIESGGDMTSPSISSKSQSLFPLNGVHKVENITNDSHVDISQPFPLSTCDNICDDLMLSESDSDENATSDNILHF